MNDKKNGRMIGVGTSSVLVIFATLALVALALLSVYTALAGQTLSRNACDSVVGYYEAELQANRILSALRGGETVEGVEVDGDVYTYSVAIDEKQRLQVSVSLAGAEYEILRWQAESRLTWEADETIRVFEVQN